MDKLVSLAEGSIPVFTRFLRIPLPFLRLACFSALRFMVELN